MPAAKRKSDVSTSASSKKARLAHTAAADSVRDSLSDIANFSIPEGEDEIRRSLLQLALYTRSLEE